MLNIHKKTIPVVTALCVIIIAGIVRLQGENRPG
jgi:hypothetical protein